MDQRIVTCRVAGKEYPMALTLRATAAITDRFGELAELGEKLQTAPFGEQLDMVLWLLARLMTDGCDLQRYQYPDRDTPAAPDEALLSLLLTPGDLAEMKSLVLRCMTVGLNREVPTEDDGKNPEAGQETKTSMPG